MWRHLRLKQWTAAAGTGICVLGVTNVKLLPSLQPHWNLHHATMPVWCQPMLNEEDLVSLPSMCDSYNGSDVAVSMPTQHSEDFFEGCSGDETDGGSISLPSEDELDLLMLANEEPDVAIGIGKWVVWGKVVAS